MDVNVQLELCLHEQAQIVAIVAFRMGSLQFLSYRQLTTCFVTIYCDPTSF